MVAILALIQVLTTGPETTKVVELIKNRAAIYHQGYSASDATRLGYAVIKAGTDHKVPVALVLAVVEVESGYRHDATSVALCKGLMQLNPTTGAITGIKLGIWPPQLEDPVSNVRVGTAYLASLYKKFGRWDHALTSYNLGPAGFRRTWRTNTYAKKVWARFQNLREALRSTTIEGPTCT